MGAERATHSLNFGWFISNWKKFAPCLANLTVDVEGISGHVENDSADVESLSEAASTDSELTEGKCISDYEITESAYVEKTHHGIKFQTLQV